MNNFWQRTLTGSVFIAVVICAIIYGPLSFEALLFIVALAGLREFYSMVESGNVLPQKIAGIGMGALVFICIDPFSKNILTIPYPVVFAAAAVVFMIELYRGKEQPFHSLGYTFIGIIYIVIPLALMLGISGMNGVYDNRIPLGFFLLLWTNDTFAYLTGRWLGKHKLFARVSPKKTWEGTIGGIIFSLIMAFVLSKYNAALSLPEWFVVALIISVTGTLGDLVESMLKRSVEVKDSGSLLPGHGGLLDRFDGLFLSVSFVYIYLLMK